MLHLGLTWMTNGDQDRMVIDPNFWCHSIPGGRWAESLPHQLYIAYALVGRMRLLHVAGRKTTDKWPWMAADGPLASWQQHISPDLASLQRMAQWPTPPC